MAQHDLMTTGIQRRRGQWRAFVRVNGRLYSKTFPRTTTRATMQAWRRQQRQLVSSVGPAAGGRRLTQDQKGRILAMLEEVAARHHAVPDFMRDARAQFAILI